MNSTNKLGNFAILVSMLWLSGCATKRALVLNNKVGPTIELREVKRGVYLSHGGIGSQRIEWQVVFRFTPWRERYSITSQTRVESEGIATRFQQGEVSFVQKRKAVDVNLKVRTARGIEPWDKNGRYLVETY